MSNSPDDFSRLKSVQVVVEERRVALQVTPETWRTHVFTGLETVPEKLRPAFAPGGNGADLDLLELVKKSYRTGRVETRFEMPYRLAGGGRTSPTVLRSVVVTVQYQRPQRSARASWPGQASAAAGVRMPMLGDALWAVFELNRAEEEVRKRYSKVSGAAIKLAVGLAKLDVRPMQGTKKLVERVIALLQRRSAA